MDNLTINLNIENSKGQILDEMTKNSNLLSKLKSIIEESQIFVNKVNNIVV